MEDKNLNLKKFINLMEKWGYKPKVPVTPEHGLTPPFP